MSERLPSLIIVEFGYLYSAGFVPDSGHPMVCYFLRMRGVESIVLTPALNQNRFGLNQIRYRNVENHRSEFITMF